MYAFLTAKRVKWALIKRLYAVKYDVSAALLIPKRNMPFRAENTYWQREM
jgi:hypothetical protein